MNKINLEKYVESERINNSFVASFLRKSNSNKIETSVFR